MTFLPCGVIAAESTELVLVNFYADWCRFSNMLEPIWDGGADLVAKKLDTRRVLMAKVDCDKEGGWSPPQSVEECSRTCWRDRWT